MRKGAKKDLLKTFRGKDDFFTKPARAGAVAVLLVEGHKSRAVRRTVVGREGGSGAARREQKRVDPEGTTEEQLQSSPLFSLLSLSLSAPRSPGWEVGGEIRVLKRATESQLQTINL